MSLLTNNEVHELDQDPLVQQAKQIEVKRDDVLVKEMEDGSIAVSLFNPGTEQIKC